MTAALFDSLPENRRQSALQALSSVVGTTHIEAISPVVGGVSGASVFRVVTAGHSYLLRIEGPDTPLRNPRQYESMRIAADAGSAPRVHYIDENARVALIDFVSTQPLSNFPGGAVGLANALGTLLARMQDAPVFPSFMAYPDLVARLWSHVCRTALFRPGILDPVTQRLEQIRKDYEFCAGNHVSSHCDILPRNVLFDGRRLWLIDWESACAGDPLIDVATALDNFAPSPEVENVLLRSWLGRAADKSLQERLALVRALTRLYYAGVLFSASARANWPVPDADLTAPTHGVFERAVRDGTIKPDTFGATHTLGKMYLASFLSGDKPPGLPPPMSQFRI